MCSAQVSVSDLSEYGPLDRRKWHFHHVCFQFTSSNFVSHAGHKCMQKRQLATIVGHEAEDVSPENRIIFAPAFCKTAERIAIVFICLFACLTPTILRAADVTHAR